MAGLGNGLASAYHGHSSYHGHVNYHGHDIRRQSACQYLSFDAIPTFRCLSLRSLPLARIYSPHRAWSGGSEVQRDLFRVSGEGGEYGYRRSLSMDNFDIPTRRSIVPHEKQPSLQKRRDTSAV